MITQKQIDAIDHLADCLFQSGQEDYLQASSDEMPGVICDYINQTQKMAPSQDLIGVDEWEIALVVAFGESVEWDQSLFDENGFYQWTKKRFLDALREAGTIEVDNSPLLTSFDIEPEDGEMRFDWVDEEQTYEVVIPEESLNRIMITPEGYIMGDSKGEPTTICPFKLTRLW